MKKFDCLDPNQKIFGTHFVEASAGTGKTFSIEHLVARFLLSLEKEIHLSEILVVTFTKAACSELKERIFKNLATIIQIHEKGTTSLSYLNSDSNFDRIYEGMRFYEESNIMTIHGFCHRMLQEYMFDSGVYFDKEEVNYCSFLKKYLKEFLNEMVQEEKLFLGQLELCLKKTPKMEDLVRILVNKDNQSKYDFSSLKEAFKTQFESLTVSLNFELLLDEFLRLQPSYKLSDFSKYDFQKEINLWGDFFEEKKFSEELFNELISSAGTIFDFFLEENKKKKTDFVLENSQYWKKIVCLFQPLLISLKDLEKIYSAVRKFCEEKFSKYLISNDYFSNEELLNIMESSLKNRNFVKAIKDRFKVVIIDEFQDTDPLQWKIFHQLFLQDSSLESLFLVGDPKQSIYRFRNADLYTYCAVGKSLQDDSLSSLDTNYRSSPLLIDSLNELFMLPKSGNWFLLPKIQEVLSYQKVKAGKKDSYVFHDDKAPIHFSVLEAEKGRYSKSLEQMDLIPKIADEILLLRQQEDLSYSSFAVLVKDRYQAMAVKKELENRNISVQMERKDLFADTTLDALIDLFETIENPFDISLLKKVLLGPFFQMPLCSIIGEESESLLLEYVSYFHFLRNTFREKSFEVFFAELFFSEKGGDLFSKAIQKDFSLFEELQLFLELFLLESKNKEMTLFEIRDAILKLKDQQAALVFPQKESVQIMTIHRSKGLEFEVVFALGCVAPTDLSKHLPEEIDELNAEKLRQLYVAFTRAKERLYIYHVFEKKMSFENSSPMSLFLGYMDFPPRSIQELKECFLELIKKNHLSIENLSDKKKTFHTALADHKKNLFFPETYEIYSKEHLLFSFSSLMQKKEKNLQIEETPKMPMGPIVGTIIHAIFEKLFQTGLYKSNEYLFLIQKEVQGSVLEGFEKDIFEKVEATLSKPLEPLGGDCLKDIDTTSFFVEPEFLFKETSSAYFKGFIDLIFMHKNKLFLIDWKTNFLGNDSDQYSSEKLHFVMEEEGYFLQASIYLKSLQKALRGQLDVPFEEIFGGVFYMFIRGINDQDNAGILHFFPPDNLNLLNLELEDEKNVCY